MQLSWVLLVGWGCQGRDKIPQLACQLREKDKCYQMPVNTLPYGEDSHECSTAKAVLGWPQDPLRLSDLVTACRSTCSARSRIAAC